MLIIFIDRWQFVSYLIRMSLLNQANHAIWQRSWSTSIELIVLTVFPWILEWMPPKKKKSLSVFVHDSKTKGDDQIVLQRMVFEISRERQGLLLQSRKKAKRWWSSWKSNETTAESSLTSFSARGASFLGREAVKRATKSREVPRRIKIVWRTVLKVYCSGREASRKTPGSGLLSIFPGKQPVNRFGWNLANLLSYSFSKKPCPRILICFFVFELEYFFSQAVLMICDP